MEIIDLENWSRKEHFAFFRSMDYPQYNMTVPVEVTSFLKSTKKRGLSFYHAMIHTVMGVANSLEEFRYRIRGEQVVKHGVVHPSYADIPRGEELFKYVTVDYRENPEEFCRICSRQLAEQKSYFEFDKLQGRDDFFYISYLPWVSYSHISHTINLGSSDSVPRVSWGRYNNEGEKVLMPFSLQVNHALLDGIHLGRFINELQDRLHRF